MGVKVRDIYIYILIPGLYLKSEVCVQGEEGWATKDRLISNSEDLKICLVDFFKKYLWASMEETYN